VKRRTSLLLSGAIALGTTLSLAGCSQSHDEGAADLMNADRARSSMQQFVLDTMTEAGGEWTSVGGVPSPDPCVLDGGDSGVSFSWDQQSEGVADPKSLVRRIEQYWRARGLTSSERQGLRGDGLTLYTVVSEGEPVRSISINASAHRTSIQVESLCGTGEVSDYIGGESDR
jgi:hypothetical protein